MEVAKIKITGADATVSDLKTITSGMIGATVAIEYDDTWADLHKQVVFRTVFRTVNAEGTIIPSEVLKTAGAKLEAGVYGYTNDGAVAIPTVWASLGMIRKGADPEVDETAKPALPLWARMQNQIGSLDELTTEAKESLVAAVNELAAKGVDARKINEIIAEYLEENEVGGKADLAVNDPEAPGYVANRTHWKETVQVPLDIRWDGKIGDRYYVSFEADGITMYFVKVSDLIIADDVLNQSTVSVVMGDATETIAVAEADVQEEHFGDSTTIQYVTVVRSKNDAWGLYGLTFTETGIYFLYTGDGPVYVSALNSETATVESVVYHKIDEKYLPDSVRANADFSQSVPGWPGYIEGLERTDISEVLYTREGFKSDYQFTGAIMDVDAPYIITYDGKAYIRKPCGVVDDSTLGRVYYYGNAALVNTEFENTGEPFCISFAPVVCLISVKADDTSVEHSVSIAKYDVKTKIPGKYLPDQLAFPTVTADDAGKTLRWVVDAGGNWVPEIVGAT